MIEYELLKIIWWVLVGVLLIGFALTDGFDMGSMALMPFVGKNDDERRLLVLFALFLRPVGFDYRSKLENTKWRSSWDWGLCIGGAVPALVFGVAFGNMFLGVPFQLDETVRSTYTGSFFALLNPFALVCGLVSLSMLAAHGGAWLMLRTDGDLRARSAKATQIMGIVFLVCFLLAGAWLYFGNIQGYTLAQPFDTNAVANPLAKQVITDANPGWMNNYSIYPITMIAPIMAILGALIVIAAAGKAKAGLSFLGTSLAVTGAILTAGFSLFPFLMPSSTNPTVSLTMWDAVASKNSLTVMTVAACIFVPLILCYTTWCYYKMWGVVTNKHIQENSHSLY